MRALLFFSVLLTERAKGNPSCAPSSECSIFSRATTWLRYACWPWNCRNDSAIGLYRDLGFVETGVRRGYYTDNREDALIMWRDPEPVA